MISSRNLNDLIPKVHDLAVKWLETCNDAGIDVLITSTYRDNESQAALYAKGRTRPGPRVTNADAGQSFHNYRCAFDFLILKNGKPAWDDIAAFKEAGAIGKALGLEYAGDWKTFKEYAHLQYTGGLTIKDLIAGKKIK